MNGITVAAAAFAAKKMFSGRRQVAPAGLAAHYAPPGFQIANLPLFASGEIAMSSPGVVGMAQLPKTPGENITVRVDWTPNTVNANGLAIPWNYDLECRFGHNTQFGWRTSGDLGFLESGFRTNQSIQIASGVARFTLFSFNAPDDPGVTWDIRVRLLAQQSDSNQLPVPGTQIEVATSEAVGAVQTVAPSQFASPGGSVGGIAVSQQ